jgi:hypothetical protein
MGAERQNVLMTAERGLAAKASEWLEAIIGGRLVYRSVSPLVSSPNCAAADQSAGAIICASTARGSTVTEVA